MEATPTQSSYPAVVMEATPTQSSYPAVFMEAKPTQYATQSDGGDPDTAEG